MAFTPQPIGRATTMKAAAAERAPVVAGVDAEYVPANWCTCCATMLVPVAAPKSILELSPKLTVTC